MKKILLIIFCLIQIRNSAQIKSKANTDKSFTKVVSIKIQKEGGSDGAIIAWHPILKKYYAAKAGSFNFPMVIADENGKILSVDDLTTKVDVRGLWYNSINKTIEGNSFKSGGIFAYKLTKGGNIDGDVITTKKGKHQPNDNSQGIFDEINGRVLFLDEGSIKTWDTEDKWFSSIIDLKYFGKGKVDFNTNYNPYYFGLSNTKGKEIILLNVEAKSLEFYDIKTGDLKEEISIPEAIDLYSSFNFCYTNNLFFFYDKPSKKWNGYKIN